MTYRFDPELVPWIAEMPAVDLSDLPASAPRARPAAVQAPAYEPPVPLDVADRLVPGLENDPDVPVRVYAPAGRSEGATRAGVHPWRRVLHRQRGRR